MSNDKSKSEIYMRNYEKNLECQLNLQEVKYIKHDSIAFYFKGMNGSECVKIKVVQTGRVYINNNLINNINLKDPFTIQIDN